MLILVLVAVFAVTMVLGVPVAFCLGLGGLAFIWLSGVVPIAVLPTLMFSGMDSFPLLAIPVGAVLMALVIVGRRFGLVEAERGDLPVEDL